MWRGPPYAITSTATGGGSAAMDEIHDGAHGSDVGLRKNAMAEIEDVTRTPAGLGKDGADLTRPLRGGCEQCRGLEIALDRTISDAGPCGIERNAPVDADDVATRCGEVLQERGGGRAGVNRRDLRGPPRPQRRAP